MRTVPILRTGPRLRAFTLLAFSAMLPAGGSAASDLSYPPPGVDPPVAAHGDGARATPLTSEQAAAREALYARGHLVILPDFAPAHTEPRAAIAPDAAHAHPPAAAPASDGAEPPPPRPAPAGGGLLWRVHAGDGPPSYVFGTIHVDDPRVLALPARVRGALLGSRSFTMEVLLDETSAQSMTTAMFYSDGRTLNEVAGERLAERAADLLAERSIPRRAAQLMKPWAAAVVLSSPERTGGDFLDAHLRRIAEQRGLPAYGLETVAEQFATFDDMTLADQVALLQQAVDDSDGVRAAVDEMIDAYLERDLRALQALTRAQQSGDSHLADKFMRRVVTQRNQRMVERMQDRLREGGAFIAVGALHLPGERGLIALLRDSGYAVTAVY